MIVRALTTFALTASTALAAETAPPAAASTSRPPAGPIDPAPPADAEPPKPPPARTITGTVLAVETAPPRITVDGKEGPVRILLDRNTAVYLPAGAGTVRDLRAGEPVRVSVAGAESRALWVELTRSAAAGSGGATSPAIPPGEAASPGAGAGPAGGATTAPGPGAPPSAPTTPGR